MSTLERSTGAGAFSGLADALKTLADEAGTLIQTLLSPNKVIREVEQMRALHKRADAIEAANPARAASLRWQASRIGLR